MMQPEFLRQPSWPFCNILNSPRDQLAAYDGNQEFFFSFAAAEDDSGISSDQFLFSKEFLKYPMAADELQLISPVDKISDDMEGIENISSDDLEDMRRWLGEDEEEGSFPSGDAWSPHQSTKSSEASLVSSPVQAQQLILPGDGVEIDNQLRIQHLLKAYGEATEMELRELAEVIMRRILEKVSPVGVTLERIGFNLFESGGKQEEYLKQEAAKNFEAAFKAFYQIFPYGRFPHFTANSAILDAIPDSIETVHVVDFDIREGIQWPPLMEALGRRRKAIRLTSIKAGEDSGNWSFEETKRRLCDQASSFGLNLKVEEVGIEGLISEVKKSRKRGGGKKEFLAFNCMVGLPHMGRGRSRSQVMAFLRVAKELLADSATNTGIIALGDGDPAERLKNCSGYSSFFDGCLNHYQALCESMEWNFPACLAEARIAMERLFITPFVSSVSWLQKWDEVREALDLQAEIGSKGLRLSKENLMEAKEIVKERESSYTVRMEEHRDNEMVLEWRGTPLVRVSILR